MQGKAIDLLYVEDNEDYLDFVGRAVKKIDTGISYEYVMDGNEAFEYFQKKNSNEPIAKMILLDINLPGMNGFELLLKLRSTPQLRYIPVIMFSTSENPEDIKRSYDLGANGYIVKPSGMTPLTDALRGLCNFWLNFNRCYN